MFRERPNRFAIVAEWRGRRFPMASCDPGRLEELLRPGARLLAIPAAAGAARRTECTAALVRHRGAWVCLMPALANRVLAAALARDGAAGLRGARVLAREVGHGRSRFDFLLRHRGRDVLTEVKSVTLVEDGRGLFPDAPTARGARHLRHLAAHARRGGNTLLVFIAQRHDAASVAPFRARDPAFTAAFDEAVAAGVRVLAYACRVAPAGVTLARRIPVEIGPLAPGHPLPSP